MFFANTDQGRVIALFIADNRAVGLDDDVVLLAILNNLALLAPGMQLPPVSVIQTTELTDQPYLDLVYYWWPDLAE